MRFAVAAPFRFLSHAGSFRSHGRGRRGVSRAGYKVYKDYIREAVAKAVSAPLAAEAVAVSVVFVYPESARMRADIEYKRGMPDLDNLLKPVLDAMNGVAFADDSRIVRLEASKVRLRGNRKHLLVVGVEDAVLDSLSSILIDGGLTDDELHMWQSVPDLRGQRRSDSGSAVPSLRQG